MSALYPLDAVDPTLGSILARAEGGGGDGAAWTVTWDVADASSVEANDMLATSPYTVAGVAVRTHDATGFTACDFDGATGLVMTVGGAAVRSLPYNNTYTAPCVIAKIADCVPGWDPAVDTVALQWRQTESITSADGSGGGLMENATPVDTEITFISHINGTSRYLSQATTARTAVIATGNFCEVIVYPGNIAVFRMGEWPGDWPDPLNWTPLYSGGLRPSGASSILYDTANTTWTAANGHWGLLAFKNAASGSFEATFPGWRALRRQRSA